MPLLYLSSHKDKNYFSQIYKFFSQLWHEWGTVPVPVQLPVTRWLGRDLPIESARKGIKAVSVGYGYEYNRYLLKSLAIMRGWQ